ncbi:hypothetical protein ANO14919_100930 [Xylariales sp. No.14919]|nr:hypothetical protein ANO14919_100930 [Xylariales sp. No.14919]
MSTNALLRYDGMAHLVRPRIVWHEALAKEHLMANRAPKANEAWTRELAASYGTGLPVRDGHIRNPKLGGDQ